MVGTDHTWRPVAASNATRRPSKAPTKTLPFQTATPRLLTSQQPLTPVAPGTAGSNTQSSLPVAAFKANTLLQAEVTYIAPSTTIGVDSCARWAASRS